MGVSGEPGCRHGFEALLPLGAGLFRLLADCLAWSTMEFGSGAGDWRSMEKVREPVPLIVGGGMARGQPD